MRLTICLLPDIYVLQRCDDSRIFLSFYLYFLYLLFKHILERFHVNLFTAFSLCQRILNLFEVFLCQV